MTRSTVCPVFQPSMADVNGPFEAYIERLERKLSVVGICRIVPPAGWTPRRKGYPDNLDLTIERPIRQHATGSRGLFRALYIEQKPMSLRDDFRPIATDPDNCASTTDPHELERKYWKNVTLRPPLYGADVPGSLFDEKPAVKGWNLRKLDTLLSRVLQKEGHSLPGVNSPYLYFGTWRSTFAWHTEDLDLYSVNYLHYGAPKSWYCISPEHRKRFEGVVKGLLPELFRHCGEFLRHKELIISPQLLEQYQIPYVRAVQYPREFVITYPGAYHAGFNHGYNCAESVNFATRKWISVGAWAGHCSCASDTVKIDMKLFRHLVPAKHLPPELFEDTESSSSEEDSDESASDDDGKRQRTNTGRAAGTARARGRGGGRGPVRRRLTEVGSEEDGSDTSPGCPLAFAQKGRRGGAAVQAGKRMMGTTPCAGGRAARSVSAPAGRPRPEKAAGDDRALKGKRARESRVRSEPGDGHDSGASSDRSSHSRSSSGQLRPVRLPATAERRAAAAKAAEAARSKRLQVRQTRSAPGSVVKPALGSAVKSEPGPGGVLATSTEDLVVHAAASAATDTRAGASDSGDVPSMHGELTSTGVKKDSPAVLAAALDSAAVKAPVVEEAPQGVPAAVPELVLHPGQVVSPPGRAGKRVTVLTPKAAAFSALLATKLKAKAMKRAARQPASA